MHTDILSVRIPLPFTNVTTTGESLIYDPAPHSQTTRAVQTMQKFDACFLSPSGRRSRCTSAGCCGTGTAQGRERSRNDRRQ